MNFNLSTVYPGTGYSIGGLPSYAKLGPFDTHPPHLEISLLACVFWKAPRRDVAPAARGLAHMEIRTVRWAGKYTHFCVPGFIGLGSHNPVYPGTLRTVTLGSINPRFTVDTSR